MSSRLMPPKVGSSIWQVRMISSAFVGGQLDIEHVDIGEAFEEDALAFHDGLAGGRADVAQSQDGGAVGDDGYQVAFGGVFVDEARVAGDFEAGHGDTGGVGQAQIALREAGLGGDDGQLCRRARRSGSRELLAGRWSCEAP